VGSGRVVGAIVTGCACDGEDADFVAFVDVFCVGTLVMLVNTPVCTAVVVDFVATLLEVVSGKGELVFDTIETEPAAFDVLAGPLLVEFVGKRGNSREKVSGDWVATLDVFAVDELEMLRNPEVMTLEGVCELVLVREDRLDENTIVCDPKLVVLEEIEVSNSADDLVEMIDDACDELSLAKSVELVRDDCVELVLAAERGVAGMSTVLALVV
jgi:hypothetical protein